MTLGIPRDAVGAAHSSGSGRRARWRRWAGIRPCQTSNAPRSSSGLFASSVKLVNDRAWQYMLLNRSPATLTRLLADPSVAGVTNVDGQGQILREPPWDVVRRWLHVPIIESPFLNEQNAAIWLYDVMFLTPLVAAGILAVRMAKRRDAAGEAPKVLAVIVLGVLFNILLIRGNLDSHLPDVIVPAALLWAWMLRGTWRARSPVRLGVAAVALLSVWMAVDVYAGAVNYLTATELFSTARNVARRLVGTIRGLGRIRSSSSRLQGARGCAR